MKTAEVQIACQSCGTPIVRIEEMRENGVVVDLYKCQVADCGRKVVIVFEPEGGYSEDQQGFVQREIARRGAFFPSDYVGRRGLGG